MPWRADLPLPRAFALRRFQNCSITKVVKNIDSSCFCTSPSFCRQWIRYANITTNITIPIPNILCSMGLVIIKSVCRRGLSSRTSFVGGSEARAIAAKVSMIRFTHRICVTVSGISVPIIEPASTSSKAATLTVSWKKRKRCMFLYSERPHITAFTILPKESSSNVMSLASFATLVLEPSDRPTWAWFKAGASLVPSPVTATT